MHERTNELIQECCFLPVGAPKPVGFTVDEFDSFSSLPLISATIRGIATLLGFYATYGGDSLPMFPDNLSVPPSGAKKSKKIDLMVLEDGTAVRNYHSTLRKITE
jgi:hypothetical protein